MNDDWVFGAVERTPERKCFFAVVPNRNAATLSALIATHINVGSILYSDCWRGYSTVQLNQLGFPIHNTVNHSLHYVDPVTGAHTNSIEGTWNGLKVTIRPTNRRRGYLRGHLAKFVWLRKNRNTAWVRLATVLYETCSICINI